MKYKYVLPYTLLQYTLVFCAQIDNETTHTSPLSTYSQVESLAYLFNTATCEVKGNYQSADNYMEKKFYNPTLHNENKYFGIRRKVGTIIICTLFPPALFLKSIGKDCKHIYIDNVSKEHTQDGDIVKLLPLNNTITLCAKSLYCDPHKRNRKACTPECFSSVYNSPRAQLYLQDKEHNTVRLKINDTYPASNYRNFSFVDNTLLFKNDTMTHSQKTLWDLIFDTITLGFFGLDYCSADHCLHFKIKLDGNLKQKDAYKLYKKEKASNAHLLITKIIVLCTIIKLIASFESHSILSAFFLPKLISEFHMQKSWESTFSKFYNNLPHYEMTQCYCCKQKIRRVVNKDSS